MTTHFINLGSADNTLTVGNDQYIIIGANGNNTLTLGSGNDLLTLGNGNNSLTLGGGTDTIKAGLGNNTITTSGTQPDNITLSDGNNTVTAGDGTATILAGNGANTITAGNGNDTVVAGNGIDKVTTGNGRSSVIVGDGNGDKIVVGTGSNIVSLGNGVGDVLQTGSGNNLAYVSAAAVGGDTIQGALTSGNGAYNQLVVTTSGSTDVSGVTGFQFFQLATGGNSISLDNTNFTRTPGNAISVLAGSSGNNTVSAAGDTTAARGYSVDYTAGTGTDKFTGGFENDVVSVSAAAVGGDTLTGGSGHNSLVLTSAGTFSLGQVSHFAAIHLAAGNSTATVTDTTLSGGVVAIYDGASGNNTISAAGDTAASHGKGLTYTAGAGTDHFTGGFENDTVYVGTGPGTFTAGSGSGNFVFISDNRPTQTIDNFHSGADTIEVYGTYETKGFDLGATDNAMNATTATAIDPTIFVANSTGGFTSSSQRFAYDTANGHLLYSATGSNTGATLVGTLTGAPAISAHDILFQH